MPQVKLFANLRKIAGTKEVSITPPSGVLRSASRVASVGAVVSELVKRHPALAANLLENGQIRPHVIITINGHPTDDENAPVTEEDIVSIFPPMAGG